jgi:hypothetical protein
LEQKELSVLLHDNAPARGSVFFQEELANQQVTNLAYLHNYLICLDHHCRKGNCMGPFCKYLSAVIPTLADLHSGQG